MRISESDNGVTYKRAKMPLSIAYNKDEKFEAKDSQFVDLLIDDCGQELPAHHYSRKVQRSLTSDNPFENLLDNFEVSRSVLMEFVRLNITFNNWAELNDLDLRKLGVKGRSVRKQMLKEFAELHKTKVPSNGTTTLVLNNLFLHLNNIKFTLVPILVQLYDNAIDDVSINDRKYQTNQVIYTLHEIDSAANRLQRQLFNLQFYRMPKKSVSGSSISLWWALFAAGVATALGVACLKNSMRISWRNSERFLVSHLVPIYTRW